MLSTRLPLFSTDRCFCTCGSMRVNGVPSNQPRFALRVVTGEQVGSTFPLNGTIITIGRDPVNDIVLKDPTVSRNHARLVQNNGQYWIEKLAPQNILKVNQQDVTQSIVRPNDTIALGRSTSCQLVVVSQGAQPVPPQVQPSQPLQPTPYPPPPSGYLPPAQMTGTIRAPDPNSSSPGVPAGTPGLEVSRNISKDRSVTPLTKPVISIGRDPHNDIVISEPIVSAFHAQIVRQGNDLVLIHPHPNARGGRTLNGLLYQGRHIQGDEQFRKALARGDIFRIGDENGTLVTLTYNDGSGRPQEVLQEMQPIPLQAPVITIGRHPDNMVVLKHPQVSAHHARLERVGNTYQLVDLNSTNHVYVNTKRISNVLLNVGDEIRIGPYRLTYTGTELRQFDESQGIRIDAVGLKKTGNNGVILLNDISLVIPPRKFVALVGGSGAGKSTLMDALNGLRPAHDGKVFYNGQDYYRSLAAFSTQLGYVPQDDIVHRDLTVERALYYAAKMRLPEDFTEEQIKQRIDEVLVDVDMEERRNLLVHKLSGGQRKRVSIALELLAKPSIFFLDEPTSGLDPGLDRKMMFLLRKLADKGHTIVLVT